MIDAYHLVFKEASDFGNVAECYITIIQLVVAYFTIDNRIDQSVKFFLVRIFEALTSGLDTIYKHNDSSFAGIGRWAWILENTFVEHSVGVFEFLLGIKIACIGSAMMCADKVDNSRRQMVFAPQVDAIFHMVGDYQSALVVFEVVVGIEIGILVFGEIEWCRCFADIVVQTAHFSKKGIAANFVD